MIKTLADRCLCCLRCGAVWVPRGQKPPVQCPKCNSPYWDREKERGSRDK
jgi:hypothetical protein